MMIMTRNATKAATKSDATDAPATTGPAVPTFPAVTDLPAIVAAYRDADAKGKAAIRAHVAATMKAAIRSADMATAAACVAAEDAIKAAVGTPDKTAPDFPAIMRARAATLIFAAHMILSNAVTPDGIPAESAPSDMIASDAALHALINIVADLADIATVRDDADKIAKARVATGTRAAKRDVPAHVIAVTDDKIGTFVTVATIAKSASDVYGDDRPSGGAVAAALFRTDKAGAAVPFADPRVIAVRKGSTCPDGTTAPADGAFRVS